MSDAILLDDRRTWPRTVQARLDKASNMLVEWHHYRNQLSDLPSDERYFAPASPHEADIEELRKQLGRLLQDRSLVAWHCSRLCDDEVALILQEGLQPLSAEHLKERIRRRLSARDFSPRVAERLAAKHSARQSSREGAFCFVLNTSCLRDEWSVESLLRHWGGEALYRLHAADAVSGCRLRSVGTPRIIEFAVPTESIRVCLSAPEMLIEFTLLRLGEEPEGSEFEGRVCAPIPPSDIRRIVSYGTAEFEFLTKESTWRKRLQIGRPRRQRSPRVRSGSAIS